jgi:hypothetical protein
MPPSDFKPPAEPRRVGVGFFLTGIAAVTIGLVPLLVGLHGGCGPATRTSWSSPGATS